MRSPHSRKASDGDPKPFDKAVRSAAEEHPLINHRRPEAQVEFVDRYGHKHSEEIFKNWSPAGLRFMEIRKVERRSRR